jgi:C-terminal processing protease CtpA/Prc
MLRSIIFSICLLLGLSSCEYVLFGPDRASDDPFVIFDYLWEEVNLKYSYFDLKGIDWDQIRQQYRNRLQDDMSEEALFEVLADMMNELRDDHSNLISPFNISRYDVALNSNPNYLARTVREHYIPKALITGAFSHDFIADGEIGYVRYGSFMSMIDSDALDFILNRYANTKGLILDLRENGGGSVANVPLLLERFAPERKLVGYFITRNGPGKNDFGPRANFNINKHSGIQYLKPIIVLIDRGSYSATTMFALATKAYPQIRLMGDATGGGGGLPNGGQLPNGWTYRFSVSQLLDLDGNNFAEEGVHPDIVSVFDWSDLSRDEIIESAIEELLTGG